VLNYPREKTASRNVAAMAGRYEVIRAVVGFVAVKMVDTQFVE
jgi:hypothetical protein